MHNTRMTDPKRAERLWLAIAVATLWLVSVGSNTDREKYTGTDEKVHPTSTSVVVEDYSSVGVPADPITASMTPVESISNTVVAENNESSLPGAQTNTPTTPTTFMEDTVVAPSIDSQIKQIVVPTISCFRRGFITILAALLKGDPIPTGQFIPDFSPAPG